ncbi:MAG: RidA family protein [Adlercreutzia sp.]
MSDPNVVVARNTDKAPVSDLYSQTVAFSHYNNLSAQLPIDPATGAIVAGGAAEQAEQCFKNLQAIVESIGHDMNDIIRVSIFLADIMDLNAVEKVQASFFPTYQPARTVAAVDALPQDALVFIEALVDNGEGTQSVPQAGDLVKLTNNTHTAPYDAGSTQTVAFSHYNNITMQLPLDPGTGRPILGDVAAQTAQCLANVKAILTSVDVPFDDIVKVTIFVKNLADASVVDDVYKTFFPDSGIARAVNYLPARTVVPVKDLPYHCDVAVEAVVSHGDGTPPQAIEDRHGLIIEACNTDAAPKCPLATQSVAFSHYNNISAQLPSICPASSSTAPSPRTAQCSPT